VSLINDSCKGMVHLEQNNIVHRDLAARNLLVYQNNGRWSVKISDLGMARKLEDYNYDSNGVIPVRWTAPEVLMYRKYYKESDVWSFGVTSWEILSRGKAPYLEILSNIEVAKFVISGHKLEIPQDCSNELWNILLQCFLERKERPTFRNLLKSLNDISSQLEYEISLYHTNNEEQQQTDYNIYIHV